MTLPQIRAVLDDARNIESVEMIFFEGGEPFLFYPSMLEGIKIAREIGFKVGIVTNAYGAISEDDADVWFRPLTELGVSNLSISDDSFHYGEEENNPAKLASAAAQKLGIPTFLICIEKPFVESLPHQGLDKGKPVIGGGAMFKGRAVEKLVAGLPRRPWHELTQCPHEDLRSPSRVHVDHYGYVQLCQGLSIGNMWQRPLSKLILEYKADSHPLCGPLAEGGPALLAKRYHVDHEQGYVDECHFCFCTRRTLFDRFPEYLGPRQVYGLEEKQP